MTLADIQETCSAISLNRQEPLIGTAPQAEIWLLLTYARPFGAKAFEESDLPDLVKERLKAELERIPGSRLLLIKPRIGQAEDRIEFRVVVGREFDPFFARFELPSYEELLDIDIGAIADSELAPAVQKSQEPFYLVCTNGRRDPCCARSGRPAFQALRDLQEDAVWESSHMGGHRFAANVLQFPQGLCYGRVTPSQAGQLIDATQDGRILIGNLRGRACYAPSAQAAEVLLRQEVGNIDDGAYRFLSQQQIADDQWSVEFRDPVGCQIHRLVIRSSTSSESHPLSCGSDKLYPATTYHLQAIETKAI